MRVIKPIDFIDQLMGLHSETDGLDVQVFKSFVGGVT
jgi:hypothetical protein